MHMYRAPNQTASSLIYYHFINFMTSFILHLNFKTGALYIHYDRSKQVFIVLQLLPKFTIVLKPSLPREGTDAVLSIHPSPAAQILISALNYLFIIIRS